MKIKQKWIPIIIFILADLVLLAFIYDDYGIGWDENSSRDIGVHNALLANEKLGYLFFEKDKLEDRITENLPFDKQQEYLQNNQLKAYSYRMYGPVFELGLVGLETILNIKDDRSLYLMRHIVTHLFFLFGLAVFYLLLYHHFQDWRISLLGTLMLLLMPRLYAHSFFNPKDIPFLVSCILATYTMVRFLDSRKAIPLIWHSLASAVAIDIRIIGFLFPAITVFILLNEAFRSRTRGKKEMIQALKQGFSYGLITTGLVILFWPYTWENPIEHLLWSLKSMSDYPWQGSLLFLGQIYTPVDYLPWYFFPTWFGVITPPVFMAGFVLSMFIFIKILTKRTSLPPNAQRLFLISFFLFLSSSALPIILGSVLYDDCRHLYFVFPFFIICSLFGFLWLFRRLESKTKLTMSHVLLLFGILLLPILGKMIRLHPYQNVYFNDLAGKNIERKFEVDYWGVSYKVGLEHILTDTLQPPPIKIMMDDSLLSPVVYNSFLLTGEQLNQIEWVDEINKADYFMTTYRCTQDRNKHLEQWQVQKAIEVKDVHANRIKILSVFRLQKD